MVLDEIASYLQSAGLGEIGQDLFVGARPDTPDVCTTILERPSVQGLSTHDNLLAQERPRLQFVCRGSADDLVGPRHQAEAIYRSLALIVNQTLSNTRYLIVIPSPPFPIGRDANSRYLICVNAEVTKNPS